MSRGADKLEDLEEALLDILERGWTPEAQIPPLGLATQNVIRVIEELLERNSS